ncbi:hypothetical protein CANARDRAFT_27726 [[Candida] arabinofermentans NRRL YB-2248]|uniref:Sulphur transport domain-containing protein n=1 Tax=[Candida] arabinofermentans NRRL YB-2248 TaxID=983967 RepID=A0A1E4T473_9ASCO|nr:hypothetical protein CANARDRAFT_27726 [[Candida] arabinofermentans NRRL YB-2248]
MFTPIESAIGAILIQYSTYCYMKTEGKVIGFSGTIYNSIINRSPSSISIILGVLLSTEFIAHYTPVFIATYGSTMFNSFNTGYSLFTIGTPSNLTLSGLLVGLGTSAGCGCTSGHMLSGLSRLRWRSLVATCIFSAFAIAVSTILDNGATCYHLGLSSPCYHYDHNFTVFNKNKEVLISILVLGFASSYIILPYVTKKVKKFGNSRLIKLTRFIVGLHSGFLFGLGLSISGMTSPSKVLGFLSVLNSSKFDPSLLMIPIFTILPNVIIWYFTIPRTHTELLTKTKLPTLSKKYDLNFSSKTPLGFLLGNALFGLGWGLGGICPGPGIIGIVYNGRNGALWLTSFMLGYFIVKYSTSKF